MIFPCLIITSVRHENLEIESEAVKKGRSIRLFIIVTVMPDPDPASPVLSKRGDIASRAKNEHYMGIASPGALR